MAVSSFIQNTNARIARREQNAQQNRRILFANARQDRLIAEEEVRRKRERDLDRERELVGEHVRAGGKPDDLAGLVKIMEPAELQALGKIAKQQETLRKQGVEAQGGASGLLQDPRTQAGLTPQARTELRDEVFQAGEDARAGGGELALRDLAARQALGPEQATFAQEAREAGISASRESAINQFAAIQLERGEVNDAEFSQVVRGLSTNPDISVAMAQELATEAEFVAKGKVPGLRREVRSTAGERGDVSRIDRLVGRAVDQYPDMPQEKLRRLHREMGSVVDGDLIIDPLSVLVGEPLFIPVSGTADASKTMASRKNQRVLIDQLDLVSNSYDRLRRAAQERGGIAHIPEEVQRLREIFGIADPAVADYMGVRFQYVSAILRATQGSRPSDFDLRMFLALAPFASEALSGAGDAKLAVLKDSLILQIKSAGDPKIAKAIRSRRDLPATAQEKELQDLAAGLNQMLEQGANAEQTLQKMDEFMTKASRWSASPRAAKFRMPGMTQPANSVPLTPEEQQINDKWGLDQ